MVKVNLLPPEIAERQRAKKITTLSVALVAVWIFVLGGLYMLKLSDVAAAAETRDQAQAEVVELQAELATLEPVRQLAERLDTHNTLLASAMANEISWARVLNDLSLAFPANASLTSLTASVQAEAEGEVAAAPVEGAPDFGAEVAQLGFTGYSVERYAPGVESVLVDFAEARGFFHSYLAAANEAEIGETEVTDFNGSVELNRKAYTNRYADGLPPEVAP
ncbi:MAG: PilN domain-containing protein [Egibacteraceae bacterium]